MSISLYFENVMVKLDPKFFYARLFVPVSLGEGKTVVLRMKVNTVGQLDLKDPGIRSKMLAKVKVISSVCSEVLPSQMF